MLLSKVLQNRLPGILHLLQSGLVVLCLLHLLAPDDVCLASASSGLVHEAFTRGHLGVLDVVIWR
ncbi:hypothetical protein C6361_25535 [Plantactinospora sp. BC1]|nr:hypothetical protein C6361_25535 [Plantactinospora sp. BC1]